MKVIEMYNDLVNGQIVEVKVYEPQKDLGYKFEWAHEQCTEDYSIFKRIGSDFDDSD